MCSTVCVCVYKLYRVPCTHGGKRVWYNNYMYALNVQCIHIQYTPTSSEVSPYNIWDSTSANTWPEDEARTYLLEII